MKERVKRFFNYSVNGIGVIEIILILVILISLILIFREQITALINKALEAITSDSDTIIGS